MSAEIVREADVEQALIKAVRREGGEAYKFTSPSRRNVPDRLVLLPGCVPFFVELKAPGKKPSKGQLREHKRIKDLSCVVLVIDTPEGAASTIEQIVRARNVADMCR